MKIFPSAFLKKHFASMLIGMVATIILASINEIAYQQSLRALALQDSVRALQGATVELAKALRATETAHRSFLLTGDERFLDQFKTEKEKTRQQLMELNRLEDDLQNATNTPADIQITPEIEQILSDMEGSAEIRKNMPAESQSASFPANAPAALDLNLKVTQLIQVLYDKRMLNRVKAANLLQNVRDSLQASRFWGILLAVTIFVAFVLYIRQRWILHERTESHNEFMASHAIELERERNQLELLVKERTAKLRELATHLQTTSEQTRSRLARELHDELGALLTATKLEVARIKSKVSLDNTAVHELLQQLNQTLNQVIVIKRRIIEDLRPSSLDNFGLVVALDILQSEFHERTGTPIDAEFEQVDLDPPSQLAVYRIVQESLNNIAKYAQAKHITIRLQSHETHIELLIRDDGVGFDQSIIKPRSHGLAGMRHRVESLRGILKVTSAPDAGTEIRARFPQLHADTLQPPLDE